MKYIVAINGELEGDYEIIGKFEERPHGKWITTNTRIINNMDFTDITCSNCKICLLADYHTPNFCPHCGAQMDKEEDK